MTYQELPLLSRREAHDRISASKDTRRKEILEVLGFASDGLTADEIARRLNREPYRVRPRITELAKAGEIMSIGRRPGLYSSINITIWKIV